MSIKSYLEELKKKTALELLQELRSDISNEALLFSDYKLDIIESTLKLYEARIKFLEDEMTIKEEENSELKKMISSFNETIGEPQIIPPTIEKKLKALEIIKKKGINMLALISSDDVDNYNYMILYDTGMKYLSEKEYLSLKEVLLYKQ